MFSLVLRGFALGFAVAASPGPIFFLCVRRTLVSGRLCGLLSGLGVATVDAFYAAVATLGVAAVATAFAGARRPLALVGGAVLVVIGVRILIERPAVSSAAGAPTGRGLLWAYASTVGLTVTNPATIVSFAALAATLGLGTAGSWLRPSAVVIGVFLGSAAWWCALVFGASSLRGRLTPGAVRAISVVSGAAIAALGMLAVLLAFSS